MRIFNGTNSTLTLPLNGAERLTIAPKTPSGNVLCSNEFLSTLITSYSTAEVAIIVSGPFEVTACANIPTAVNYVVQSLDEAIQRFAPKAPVEEKKEEPKPVEPEPEPVVEPEPVEPEQPETEIVPAVEEDVLNVPEEEPIPEGMPEPVEEETKPEGKPFGKKDKKKFKGGKKDA